MVKILGIKLPITSLLINKKDLTNFFDFVQLVLKVRPLDVILRWQMVAAVTGAAGFPGSEWRLHKSSSKKQLMNKAEAKIIRDEAELVVRENCARLIKTLSEFGYAGAQCDAFVQIASSHLLGGSLDLWLEVHGGDTDTLARFVCARIEAKKKRDAAEKRRKTH
jgi:hypothetical protein